MEVSAEVLSQTKALLEQVIAKPKPSEKLLSKPPFKFLHDVVTNIISATGFAKDLYTPDELDQEKSASSKENKISFLEKIIKYVSEKSGQQLSARPGKIVAGQEPEQTNIFLQTFAKVAKQTPSKQEAVPEKTKKKKREAEEEKEKPKSETKTKSTKGEKGSEGKKEKSTKKSTKKEKEVKKKEKKSEKKEEKEERREPVALPAEAPPSLTQEKKEALTEVKPPEKKEPDFGDMVRNTSLERPKTAAKPPPKLRDSASAVEKISVETAAAT